MGGIKKFNVYVRLYNSYYLASPPWYTPRPFMSKANVYSICCRTMINICLCVCAVRQKMTHFVLGAMAF